MTNSQRYPFVSADVTLGEAGFRPYLPITLVYQQNSYATASLLDTGATVNVLSYSIGVELGYVWKQQTTPLRLTGNLAQYDSRAVVAQAIIGQFEPVQLSICLDTSYKRNTLIRTSQFFHGV